MRGEWRAISNRQVSNKTNLRCGDVLWIGPIFDDMTDLRRRASNVTNLRLLAWAWGVRCCSIDVFVFRFALVISNLVILDFWFSYLPYFENPWICYLCNLLGLPWAWCWACCPLFIYLFFWRICGLAACFVTIFFFFFL